jgi:hypothetical protein
MRYVRFGLVGTILSLAFSARAADPPKSAGEPIKELAVGKEGEGSFQPSVLMQSWLLASRQSVRGPADDKTVTLRVRRAELKAKGEIVPKVIGYQVMVDGARALEPSTVSVTVADGSTVNVPQSNGPLTLLGDASISFFTDYADVSVGQFKMPLSYEGFNSSSKILFPERAPVARFYGDKRDIGVKVEKKLGYIGYAAGVFNGSGQNKLDSDRAKDLVLRLEGYPIEGLTIAAVGAVTAGTRDETTRDRVEFDVRYEGFGFTVLAEHLQGWDRKDDQKAVRGHGTYLACAYTLFDTIQPMVRVGELEPNRDKWGDHYRHYEAGVAWLLRKNEAKVTLAVSGFDPTHTDHEMNLAKTEGILAAQASF